jgi:hypothetical protein
MRSILDIIFSILIFGMLVLSIPSQAVILTTDETTFLDSSAIVSTETFNSMVDTIFPTKSVTIDSVTYTDVAASSWAVEETNFGIVALFSTDSGEANTIEFEDKGFVKAIGFNIIPFGFTTGEPFFEFTFDVQERRGGPTTFTSRPIPGQKNFFGFSSGLGLQKITVFQQPGQGGRTNWSYDDISRSAIVPEPTTLSLLSLGLAGLGFARRKMQS